MISFSARVDLGNSLILRRGGGAERLLARMLDDAEREAAEVAEREIVSRFDRRIRHQTPIYVPGIHVERMGEGYGVTDGGQPYNYWLEGTGSRNRARPGFPGYHVWSQVAQVWPRRAQRLVERAVDRIVRRLG